MKRFDCMKALAARLQDELVILSLGASVDEWYNAAPHMRSASLFQQQLGCVTAQAFGLACGLPHRRIVSLDTDGGMMFNLGILATLIVSWYSRQREFRADHGGASLAGKAGMISALEALKQSHGQPMPTQMQAFGINTGGGGGFMRLFMTHPPLDERIAALRAATP